MAVNGDLLATLLKTRMDAKFKSVIPYSGPLAQNNPSYYLQFCDAIGKGIIDGSPVINFITKDIGLSGGPPIVGTGNGIGIKMDKNWFLKNLYIEIRDSSLANYGTTSHPPWCDDWDAINDPLNPLPPEHCSLNPNQYNPYNFLTAMCEAIAECVSEHNEDFRILQSTHPTVYLGQGEIEERGFIGLVPNAISSAILGYGSNFTGSFWPVLCEKIGSIYARTIMEHSTGKVIITGSCVPSTSQVCGLPGVGAGTGTAD
jgi:hypothetical protein